MKLGVFVENSRTSRGGGDIDQYVAAVRRAAEAGFASVWSPHVFGLDALTAIAVAGREVPGIEFGTGVVPIYGRHPMALAQQTLTTQHVVGGRLTLGIGLSHQIVVETMWGYSFDKPARHMREYLDGLLPLLRERTVNAHGETVTAVGEVRMADTPSPSVVVAALGPTMLRLAGSVTDGTVTWMTGPQTIESHVAPTLTKAAADAGRPEPRIVVALPTCVTDDEGAARERAGQLFSMYGMLPSYRAMLDREGAAGPADVAIVGTASKVQDAIRDVEGRGTTEFVAAPFDNVDATLDAVAALL